MLQYTHCVESAEANWLWLASHGQNGVSGLCAAAAQTDGCPPHAHFLGCAVVTAGLLLTLWQALCWWWSRLARMVVSVTRVLWGGSTKGAWGGPSCNPCCRCHCSCIAACLAGELRCGAEGRPLEGVTVVVQSWVCRSATCKPACTQHAENTGCAHHLTFNVPQARAACVVWCQHLRPAFVVGDRLPLESLQQP